MVTERSSGHQVGSSKLSRERVRSMAVRSSGDGPVTPFLFAAVSHLWRRLQISCSKSSRLTSPKMHGLNSSDLCSPVATMNAAPLRGEHHQHGFRLARDGARGLAVKPAVITARVLRFDLKCLATMGSGRLVPPGKAQGELVRQASFSLFFIFQSFTHIYW